MITKASEIVDILKELIEEANDGVDFQLLHGIFIGDQQLIPHTPTLCLFAGPTARTYVGAPRYTEAVIQIYIIIYHCHLKDAQETEQATNRLAEAISSLVEADTTLGGNVLDTLVAANEPGYADRARSTYKASRLTVRVKAREVIGAAA